MTKKPAKRPAKQPAKSRIRVSGDDSSPIIVGCSSTGVHFHVPLRIQKMVAPSSLYIRLLQNFDNAVGGVTVTYTSLKVYNVGSTGYQYTENSPIDGNWNLNINKGSVTITSADNVTVSIQTSLQYHVESAGNYMYLIFPQGTAIQSVVLNGDDDLWAEHKKYTVGVDFYVPTGGGHAVKSKRNR